jgi:glycosyltransferase involved in cell wall biosynthesis
LYAGRLSPEKNLALLIDVMERLTSPAKFKSTGRQMGASPDCRLLIAGSGPLEGWLREQARRLGGRLRLLGHLCNRDEMARLLASVDVFVHPNPREPFGIGPFEAMASGTPLVAPDAGGVLDYADSTCAWPAKPEGGTFTDTVHEVLSNPPEARTKVQRARRRGALRLAKGHWPILRHLRDLSRPPGNPRRAQDWGRDALNPPWVAVARKGLRYYSGGSAVCAGVC